MKLSLFLRNIFLLARDTFSIKHLRNERRHPTAKISHPCYVISLDYSHARSGAANNSLSIHFVVQIVAGVTREKVASN